jgi:hypothetical protein
MPSLSSFYGIIVWMYYIKKCRTNPYLAYPQFDRYLTGGQLKVINCLLRAGGASSKAFPSNDRIAWETGLKQDSVRVIKCELGKLGVVSKQEIKRGNNTIWIYTVDTTWKREQYKAEFNERYNEISEKHNIPHIHAEYAGEEASIAFDGEVLSGSLTKAKMKLLLAWMEIHREELEANWSLAMRGEALYKIEPLR